MFLESGMVFGHIIVRSKQMESRRTAMKDPKENQNDSDISIQIRQTNKFQNAKSVLQEKKEQELRYGRRRNKDVYCPNCADWPESSCVRPAKDGVKALTRGVKQADLYSCLLWIELHTTGLQT